MNVSGIKDIYIEMEDAAQVLISEVQGDGIYVRLNENPCLRHHKFMVID
ncbi:MAG: hypothetical protein QXM16_03645 [Nitrososphaerota archaeon]